MCVACERKWWISFDTRDGTFTVRFYYCFCGGGWDLISIKKRLQAREAYCIERLNVYVTRRTAPSGIRGPAVRCCVLRSPYRTRGGASGPPLPS